MSGKRDLKQKRPNVCRSERKRIYAVPSYQIQALESPERNGAENVLRRWWGNKGRQGELWWQGAVARGWQIVRPCNKHARLLARRVVKARGHMTHWYCVAAAWMVAMEDCQGRVCKRSLVRTRSECKSLSRYSIHYQTSINSLVSSCIYIYRTLIFQRWR